MSYSSLTSTQFVSRNNLQDAVNTAVITLNAGQTIPTGLREVNKQDLLTYANVDPANTFLSTKSNLQLIAKRDITALTSSGIVEVEVSNLAEFIGSDIPGFSLTGIVTSSSRSPYFSTHTGFTGSIAVTIRSANIGDVVELVINGTIIETIPTANLGLSTVYNFTSLTIAASDYIKIYLYNPL